MSPTQQYKLSNVVLVLGMLLMVASIGMLVLHLRNPDSAGRSSFAVMGFAVLAPGIGLWVTGTSLRAKSGR